jgi:hypothetical protein
VTSWGLLCTEPVGDNSGEAGSEVAGLGVVVSRMQSPADDSLSWMICSSDSGLGEGFPDEPSRMAPEARVWTSDFGLTDSCSGVSGGVGRYTRRIGNLGVVGSATETPG